MLFRSCLFCHATSKEQRTIFRHMYATLADKIIVGIVPIVERIEEKKNTGYLRTEIYRLTGALLLQGQDLQGCFARRFSGAVAMTEKSRIPSRLIASVRGIGVAVSVNTSTSARSDFSFSFCRTPNRCSSSMMMSPKRAKVTFSPRSL